MTKAWKFGRTSVEREKAFEDMKYLYEEKQYSLDDIGKKYNASKQAVNQFLTRRGYVPCCEKDINKTRIRKKVEGSLLEEKYKCYEKRYNYYRIQTCVYKKKANQRKEIIIRIINSFDSFLKDKDIFAFSLTMKSILEDFERMESTKSRGEQ